MRNNRKRETMVPKKLKREKSDTSINSDDKNRLVKEGKTRTGHWLSEKVRQFDAFKLKDAAKKWFD